MSPTIPTFGSDPQHPSTSATSLGQPPRALPPSAYLDQEIYEKEIEQLFHRSWVLVGHVTEVENPGDYFTCEIAGQSLFVVRTPQDGLKAFYNVCQHRAHELLKDSGSVRAIVCPYHAWTYNLDGRLRKAPNQQRVPGFDASRICLTGIRLESLCGFLFVNLDETALPLAEAYGDLEAQFRTYVPEGERLRRLRRVSLVENCNWKVSVENYSECYHCQVAHPAFTRGVVAAKSYRIEPQDHCLRHLAEAAPAEKAWYDRKSLGEAEGYSSWYLWPLSSIQVYPGGVVNLYRWIPEGTGRTRILRDWYFMDGEAREDQLAAADQDRETTVAEDVRIVESVQRGLASKGYRPGPLMVDPSGGVNSEHSLVALQIWWHEAMGRP